MAPPLAQPRRHASSRLRAAMFESLLGAFALVLVIEGLLPFISPVSWRQVFARVLAMSDGQIRFVGLTSMLAGLLLLLVLWQ